MQSRSRGRLLSQPGSVSPTLRTNSSINVSALPRSGQESQDLTCLGW